jgi:hypothetical protein
MVFLRFEEKYCRSFSVRLRHLPAQSVGHGLPFIPPEAVRRIHSEAFFSQKGYKMKKNLSG